MKSKFKNILREQGLDSIEKQKDMVQDVVDKVYPHIVTKLGPSKYREEIPNVEIWNDIYARYSGIPEMRGEDSETTKAEWKAEDNTIYVYYPNMSDTEDIIRSLLHEYAHSLQNPEEREENRKDGYELDPDEIAAHEAEEKWKDYLVYIESNLNEQEESKEPLTPNGFSPQLITYLKYIFTLYSPKDFYSFETLVNEELEINLEYIQILYLTLLYNCNLNKVTMDELLNEIPYEDYETTNLYEYEVQYNGPYDSWEQEEDCVEENGVEAYGDRSGDPCDCDTWDEVYVMDDDGVEEGLPCNQAEERLTDKQKEEINFDENDCDCLDWENKHVEVYLYPIVTDKMLSPKLLEGDLDVFYRQDIDDLGEGLDQEGVDYIVLSSEDEEGDELEAEVWDYFQDSEEGEIKHLSLDVEYSSFEVIEAIEKVSKSLSPKRLTEQDEQMNLFPTGEWEFPAGWEEEDDDYISDQKHNVPEPVFKKIMDMWDEGGIDFSVFKLLGVPNDSVTQTFVLKRYIQNTKKPIPVSYTFDCHDLKELFDTNNRDYDLSYVPAYLCGEDSFWDHEQWYNYEWESYMADMIDENNWKTISQIFGGVSQSVAEDILTKNSSSEEVDELIEKYDEEIDDIRNWMVWSNNDEHEYAVKNGMAKDIEDKLVDHFDGEGHLHTDNKGSKSWTIEGDLRDYVNDIWDNTEDVFEYHPDYASETLEGAMMDSDGPNMVNLLFLTLMEEEYRFWDYCEGKRGECLDLETKWFDGYWYPDIDINESLADRLMELTYEPTITTPEGDTQPMHEQEVNWYVDDGKNTDFPDSGFTEPGGKFTPFDVRVLNYLTNQFTLEELQQVATEDDTQYSNDIYNKWSNAVKLFGENLKDGDSISYGRSTRFAKWIVDNIQNAGLPGDDNTIDFGRVENPIKAWPSVYRVDGTEDGWEQVYRTGDIDIVAYDKEDAEERAEESWWEYEPDMETTDYGDYDVGDFELGDATHLRLIENKSSRPINEQEEVELDETPFSVVDIKILNNLSKNIPREKLREIWEEDESNVELSYHNQYLDVLKLYGVTGNKPGDVNNDGWALATRFAKWADDNWEEAERAKDSWEQQFGEEGEEDMGPGLDFGMITNPIKEWPNTYSVSATESYWIKEYRMGETEINAYSRQDATTKAYKSWWEYDVDMEYGDQGDSDNHEFDVEEVDMLRSLKENKNLKKLVEYYTNHTLNLYELIRFKNEKKNTILREELIKNIKKYIHDNSLNKDIFYINEEDLITYLLNHGLIVEDKIKNLLIIEEPQINTEWWKNLPKKEKKHILEHGVMPVDDEAPQEIPESIKKFLVIARFESKGTWGVAPTTFLLYMKPSGEIMYSKKSSSLSSLPSQFNVGSTVTFGDLISFEKGSRYNLTMRGQLRETYLSTGRKLIETHTIKVTPQKQFYLKSLLREMEKNEIDELLRVAKSTKIGWEGGPGRLKVFEFLNKLRDSGLVNMFQAPDFLWSGSKWMRKYIDLHQPESLESIDEYEDSESTINHKETIEYLLDNADRVRDVIISNVLGKAELKGDNTLDGANRLMRPAAIDMVKLWSGHFVK